MLPGRDDRAAGTRTGRRTRPGVDATGPRRAASTPPSAPGRNPANAALAARGLNSRAASGRDERANPIIAWLRDQRRPMREILEETAAIDASMAQGLPQSFDLRDPSRRLALTLFIQYTQSQGLSGGELALLLGDAEVATTQALNYLIGAALRESALSVVDDAVCCGEPVIALDEGVCGVDDPGLWRPVL